MSAILIAVVGAIGSVALSTISSVFVADRRVRKERANYLMDKRREAFAAMLAGVSEVMNSGDYKEKWAQYRAAKAVYLLYAPKVARAKLQQWENALDETNDIEVSRQLFDELTDTLRLELGDKSLERGS